MDVPHIAPAMEEDLTPERLWKVTLSSLFPNDHRVEMVYEGYHAREEAACDAALYQEATDYGGSTIPTIVKVEDAGLESVHRRGTDIR